MNERPLPPPTLEPLMENELVSINNESMLLSIHRYSEMERVTFETAAVLNNGRWEIPKSGGAEKLEPGLTVNFGEDIIKLSPKKLKQKRLQELRDEGDFDTMSEDKLGGGGGGGGEGGGGVLWEKVVGGGGGGGGKRVVKEWEKVMRRGRRRMID